MTRIEQGQKNEICFGEFKLDRDSLWKAGELIRLRPKTQAVLRFLAERAGRLVTKDELLDAIWTDTAVTDAVLKVCVRDIRKALGDDAETPRFIETAHRRGYRFIGCARNSQTQAQETLPDSGVSARLIGRESDLLRMDSLLRKSLDGVRQVLFVTGEAGIGKTALVEQFCSNLSEDVLVARGQCIERFGSAEAFHPLLEAIGRLCRRPNERAINILREHAPTWLVQLPSLVRIEDREQLARDIFGATPERMLREMSEALEALTRETPLVLVIEDLQWSDYSTLDIIGALATRREHARLMIIATYRPVDAILNEHPVKSVKQELVVHRKAVDLQLDFLPKTAVDEYLQLRFPENSFPQELARLIHQRTEGNPLFLINIVDYFLSQDAIAQTDSGWNLVLPLSQIELGVPDSVRQIIERQIDRLTEVEQLMMEAASLAGHEFSSAAVATALEADAVRIEELCERVVRRHQFIQCAGEREWPDGSVSSRYRFRHALYRSTLAQRLSPARRAQIHLRLAEYGERIYGECATEIAAELAMHFEHGRAWRRAIACLQQAAARDARRYANRESMSHLTHALELVERLAEGERTSLRISLMKERGQVRRSMGDMIGAVGDSERIVIEARCAGLLSEEITANLSLASALSWVDRDRCLETAAHALRLAEQIQDEHLQAHVKGYCGYWNLLMAGWRPEDDRASRAAVDSAKRKGDSLLLAVHGGRYSYFQSLRSDYENAIESANSASVLQMEQGNVFEFQLSQYFKAWAELHDGRFEEAMTTARDGVLLAEKNGHDRWRDLFSLQMAWIHVETGNHEESLRIGEPALDRARAADHPVGVLLGMMVNARACLGSGRTEDALRYFQAADKWLSEERILMDWIIEMPLSYGYAGCMLALDRKEEAMQQARKLIESAAVSGERTYLALGRVLMAEIALSEDDCERAAAELEVARGAIKDIRAMLARGHIARVERMIRQHLTTDTHRGPSRNSRSRTEEAESGGSVSDSSASKKTREASFAAHMTTGARRAAILPPL